jgi:hypothetical protein
MFSTVSSKRRWDHEKSLLGRTPSGNPPVAPAATALRLLPSKPVVETQPEAERRKPICSARAGFSATTPRGCSMAGRWRCPWIGHELWAVFGLCVWTGLVPGSRTKIGRRRGKRQGRIMDMYVCMALTWRVASRRQTSGPEGLPDPEPRRTLRVHIVDYKKGCHRSQYMR